MHTYMGRSHQTYNKKEIEKKKKKKQQEKRERREERKANAEEKSPGDMIAYVDEYGNISDTPPDPAKKKKVKAKDIVIGVPKQEKVEEPTVRTGKIEFFNDEKGYGFVKESDSGEKYFVHVSGTEDDVRENDKVTFELEPGMKGMQAVRVKLA